MYTSNLCKFVSIFALILLTACVKRSTDTDEVISQAAWHDATEKAVEKIAPQAEQNLKPYFVQANLSYPPKRIAVLAFKKEKKVELWAKNPESTWHHIRNYPLTAFSGTLGPKLKRNDRQIPEGIYRITLFNPFSTQHLSMMLNYPNAFDKFMAKHDGRKDLGDNIFIHGKAKSVGCLAIGDKAIDELFVLVKEVGKNNTKVIIAPNDMRVNKANLNTNMPQWTSSLYHRISSELRPFQRV